MSELLRTSTYSQVGLGRTAVLDKTDLKLVDTYWKSRSGVSVNESARGSLGNEKSTRASVS